MTPLPHPAHGLGRWLAVQPRPCPAHADDPVWGALTPIALGLTPHVALRPPAVLLELSASLRLWGGQAGVEQTLRAAWPGPTPLVGAWGATSWLAWARLVVDRPRARAADLPLAVLPALAPHAAWLHALGWHSWGDLDAQPRGALARRLGAAALTQLDQALGRSPEVLDWLSPPDSFDASLDLPAPAHQASALLAGASQLLQQLALWLRARQRGALGVTLHARCQSRAVPPPEPVWTVRSTQAAQDPAHLQGLLAEQLARHALPAPVLRLRLRLIESAPWQAPTPQLFDPDPPEASRWPALVERLSARLGAAQVLAVQSHDDHRPERRQRWVAALAADAPRWMPQNASINVAVTSISASDKGQNGLQELAQANARPGLGSGGCAAPRADQGGSGRAVSPVNPDALAPTWLLPEPRVLPQRDGLPWLDGAPLRLLSGPQRIEAGWWDTSPARRDYHLAAHPDGRRLWVYGQPGGDGSLRWLWHGVYG